MADDDTDRRGELIAAALADDLDPTEAAELERRRAEDPSIDAELEELGGLTARLASLGDWTPVPEDLGGRKGSLDLVERRVLREIRRDGGRTRRSVVGGVAAASLLIGLGVGVFVPRPDPSPPTGAPGEHGVVEPLTFEGSPSGVGIRGDVVAHSWGTETLLRIDGLPPGESYRVIVVGDDGTEYPSGSFLGSEVEIDCAVNAAALREDVIAVEVREDDGDLVAAADLPDVAG